VIDQQRRELQREVRQSVTMILRPDPSGFIEWIRSPLSSRANNCSARVTADKGFALLAWTKVMVCRFLHVAPDYEGIDPFVAIIPSVCVLHVLPIRRCVADNTDW